MANAVRSIPMSGFQLKLHDIVKVLSFLIGASIALMAILWIFMAASGALKADPLVGYVSGAGFLLVAESFLAFTFSGRVAKAMSSLVMFGVAIGMLWFAFQPGLPTMHPRIVQTAAVAFALTLFAHGWRTQRRIVRR